jgi:hypothetical protein
MSAAPSKPQLYLDLFENQPDKHLTVIRRPWRCIYETNGVLVRKSQVDPGRIAAESQEQSKRLLLKRKPHELRDIRTKFESLGLDRCHSKWMEEIEEALWTSIRLRMERIGEIFLLADMAVYNSFELLNLIDNIRHFVSLLLVLCKALAFCNTKSDCKCRFALKQRRSYWTICRQSRTKSRSYDSIGSFGALNALLRSLRT